MPGVNHARAVHLFEPGRFAWQRKPSVETRAILVTDLGLSPTQLPSLQRQKAVGLRCRYEASRPCGHRRALSRPNTAKMRARHHSFHVCACIRIQSVDEPLHIGGHGGFPAYGRTLKRM